MSFKPKTVKKIEWILELVYLKKNQLIKTCDIAAFSIKKIWMNNFLSLFVVHTYSKFYTEIRINCREKSVIITKKRMLFPNR